LSGVEEHKRDQEPPDATIAVQKRVDGLELHLGDRGFDERRQAVVRGMVEALERGHAMLDVLRRGGTKLAVPGRVPPIQFWLRRNSPGCLSAPRPRASSYSCTSRSRRLENGKPSRIRAMPCSRAAT
jgi:hypothetical protein